MKLTKEESLIALYRLTYLANCNSNVNEIVWSQILKEVNELDQLINEHFDSSLTQEKLEKALDKACELLEPNVTKREFHVDEYGGFDLDVPIRTKKEWKEYLLNEVD